MSASRVAIRYARALVDVLAEKNKLDGVESFYGFCDLVAGHKELSAVFANVTVDKAQKAAVAASLADKGGLDELTRRFIKAIADNGRLDILREIREAVAQRVDKSKNIQSVTLTCAAPPADEDLSALRAGLEKALGCQVRVETRQDPAILGGVIARVGSTIYDGSISGRLNRLRRELVKENN